MSHAVYRIRRDGEGSGGFLCPPGHPNHEYVVYGYWPRGNAAVNPDRRSEPDLIAGLDCLITNEYGDVSEGLQRRAQAIMDAAPLVCSEAWVRSVYGYFRNSYAPESGSRNVSDAVIYKPVCRHCGKRADHTWHEPDDGRDFAGDRLAGHPYEPAGRPPAWRHLGYLMVREYFPDHQPREDLIADPGQGYGSYPCVKCGTTVQYEARADAWCEVISGRHWRYIPECPRGGKHEV